MGKKTLEWVQEIEASSPPKTPKDEGKSVVVITMVLFAVAVITWIVSAQIGG